MLHAIASSVLFQAGGYCANDSFVEYLYFCINVFKFICNNEIQ